MAVKLMYSRSNERICPLMPSQTTWALESASSRSLSARLVLSSVIRRVIVPLYSTSAGVPYVKYNESKKQIKQYENHYTSLHIIIHACYKCALSYSCSQKQIQWQYRVRTSRNSNYFSHQKSQTVVRLQLRVLDFDYNAYYNKSCCNSS